LTGVCSDRFIVRRKVIFWILAVKAKRAPLPSSGRRSA
jgi:hypothetical protein